MGYERWSLGRECCGCKDCGGCRSGVPDVLQLDLSGITAGLLVDCGSCHLLNATYMVPYDVRESSHLRCVWTLEDFDPAPCLIDRIEVVTAQAPAGWVINVAMWIGGVTVPRRWAHVFADQSQAPDCESFDGVSCDPQPAATSYCVTNNSVATVTAAA